MGPYVTQGRRGGISDHPVSKEPLKAAAAPLIAAGCLFYNQGPMEKRAKLGTLLSVFNDLGSTYYHLRSTTRLLIRTKVGTTTSHNHYASIGALMPLETGTFLPDLNASNPAHTDGINAGDAHIRLIKSVLKNTFPNFTDAALNSTQSAIDATVTAVAGVFKAPVDGTISAPAYTFASEPGLGFYRKATNTLALAIAGVDVWKISGGGVDIITAGALLAGGTPIFPLQAANIGAAQVLTAALAPNAVTYAKLQNSVAANTLLGAPTAAGPFQEITLGSGLGISGGVLSNTAATFRPIQSVLNLAIDNDGTTPNTKINVTADAAVLVDNSGNTQSYFSISCLVDFTTTGANGCDVGTRAASKGYFIYLIGNGTVVKALATLDNVTATLPSGFTQFKLVGWYRTDGSSNLFKIRTRGGDAVYTTAYPVAASGASGGSSGSLSGIVSPQATKVLALVTSNSVNVSFQPNSANSYYSMGAAGGTLNATVPVEMMLDSGLSFWYTATGAAASVSVRGWSFPQ